MREGFLFPFSRHLTCYRRVTSKGYPTPGTCTTLQYHFYYATCPYRCIHESLLVLYQLGNYYGRYTPHGERGAAQPGRPHTVNCNGALPKFAVPTVNAGRKTGPQKVQGPAWGALYSALPHPVGRCRAGIFRAAPENLGPRMLRSAHYGYLMVLLTTCFPLGSFENPTLFRPLSSVSDFLGSISPPESYL